MSFIDMMMNSLLEIWNLVWTKPQTGASHQERIRHLHYCTWAQQIFAFFFGPGFLRDFVQGIFSALFDDFIIQVFTDYTLKNSLMPIA